MAKEYLKMVDVFVGDVKAKHIDEEAIAEIIHGDDSGNNWSIEDSKYWLATSHDHAKYAAHAINSHDELVAEVERLRAQIKDAFIDGCQAGWDASGEGFNAEYCTMSDDKIREKFIAKADEYTK